MELYLHSPPASDFKFDNVATGSFISSLIITHTHTHTHMLTAFGLTPVGSSTVHTYTQTMYGTTQLKWEECGLCSVFASYTLPFALQLRKKHGKPSVRVAEDCHLAR
jgi:hypothetical protein